MANAEANALWMGLEAQHFHPGGRLLAAQERDFRGR